VYFVPFMLLVFGNCKGGQAKMKLRYEIYKRGHVYRLASPGLLRWNWYKDIGTLLMPFGGYQETMFETRDILVAQAKRNIVNRELADKNYYKNSRWKHVSVY
jgi:hypothetical protein